MCEGRPQSEGYTTVAQRHHTHTRIQDNQKHLYVTLSLSIALHELENMNCLFLQLKWRIVRMKQCDDAISQGIGHQQFDEGIGQRFVG